ncbi:MAG: asparagine synthase (glutamine-hydrolyzing) [Gammaproteobacteria bacterium]|nr:asparagine synthase (glutamine-hydrolyzing) [Gammaproteobacteria bacterium]
MCGIAGIIKKNLSGDDIAYFSQKFSNSIKHRGPDDSGSWHEQQSGVLLTHRRLSIHDLSPLGAQPMHSASNRYCIVFNGEIYNYQELRTELSQYGHTFRGGSDTEILLAAIEQWGTKSAVSKFIGMFAFALWDKQNKTLQLCRDRLGEKPLYYGFQGDVFYFASELHAIESVCPADKLEISLSGLQHYLQYGYISSPQSIYKGFQKLLPGSLLTIPIQTLFKGNSNLSPEIFWSLRQVAESGLQQQLDNFDTAVDSLNTKLHEVIKRQLLADVNVGLFLSGGIDSTTVTAIAQDVSSQKVKTFTIGYHEKEYDESGYAGAIAQHLNTDHTTLYLSPDDAKSVIPNLPKIYDEPFADSSQIPAYLVSKLAREHVTVCLSGDGGDELFAGYNRYLMTDRIWHKIDHIPSFIRKIFGKTIDAIPAGARDAIITLFYKNKQGSLQSKVQKLADLMQSSNIMSAYDVLSSYWPHPRDLLKGNVPANSATPLLSETRNFIDQAMYIDQIRYLEGDNLAKTDRASMAVSLETRLPLLSHDIVELAWRMPTEMKVHRNISKWVLRNVLYKYVPEKMVNRPKMGFSVPIAQWLRNDLKEWADDHFSALNNHDLLHAKPILQAWATHKSGKADHAHKLWTILMFLAWQQERKHIF